MMLSLNSVDQETIKDSNRKRILQLLSKKRIHQTRDRKGIRNQYTHSDNQYQYFN